MVTLNRLGRVDSLFMVVPKRPVRFDAPGNYQLAITARSRDGRTTRRITVRDSQSTSAVTSIAQVDSLNRSLRVQGHTGRHNQLWLGCTLNPSDPRRQLDLEAVAVRGPFAVEFVIRPGDRARRGDSYVVSLWQRKIQRDRCRLGTNGRPCGACAKMGYHLEGRLDRKDGSWSPR